MKARGKTHKRSPICAECHKAIRAKTHSVWGGKAYHIKCARIRAGRVYKD